MRINAARTELARRISRRSPALAAGIRIPKVESAEDVQWVADRAPGTPLICAIETARGVLAATEIATVPGVRHLSMGGVDLRRDLDTGDGDLPMLYVRSHLVVVSRAAGLAPPIDSVYPHLDDDAGLRAQARVRALARLLRQVGHPPPPAAGVHDVFSPPTDESPGPRGHRGLRERRRRSGEAPGGEFVDLPVADRARRLLELAAELDGVRAGSAS